MVRFIEDAVYNTLHHNGGQIVLGCPVITDIKCARVAEVAPAGCGRAEMDFSLLSQLVPCGWMTFQLE